MKDMPSNHSATGWRAVSRGNSKKSFKISCWKSIPIYLSPVIATLLLITGMRRGQVVHHTSRASPENVFFHTLKSFAPQKYSPKGGFSMIRTLRGIGLPFVRIFAEQPTVQKAKFVFKRKEWLS